MVRVYRYRCGFSETDITERGELTHTAGFLTKGAFLSQRSLLGSRRRVAMAKKRERGVAKKEMGIFPLKMFQSMRNGGKQ